MAEYICKEKLLKIYEDQWLHLQKTKNIVGNETAKYVQSGINWCINVLKEEEAIYDK